MLRPSIYKAIVQQKTQASSKVTKVIISYTSPLKMQFIPGQFINLKCPTNKYRAYSIASDYKNHSTLALLIETGHNGLAANYVRNLKINGQIEFIGPSGMLTLHEPVPQHLVLFATGTGIAPFIAMLYRLIDIKYEGKLEIFFGVKTESDILEKELLLHLLSQLLNASITIYTSLPTDGFKTGRITDELNKVLDLQARYYACGHPAMVTEVKERLIKLGVLGDNIIVEGFTHSRAL